MTAIRVAALADVAVGQPTFVEAGATRVVLVRIGDRVHALGDLCAARLACPWHGWMYDVRTGQCVFPGRGAAVPTYPVRLENDEIWVEVS